ncbi:TolC family protein [Flavobacterium salmonis]|uniref:Transporter n=1 Tax=Flavobacterium salmonis TaxID=2654844 RepID=A0A6V6YNA3_9FLAO|nr:TolC family protein [Flavobacterium salmonis]CAD0000981.1 transporter [Flavobacterium salmonis]
MKNLQILVLILGMMHFGYSQTQLTVEQIKSMAVKNNSKVKNSALELEAAKESKQEMFTNYFPKVTASAIGMQALDPLLEIKMKGGNLPVYDGNAANLAGAAQFAYMPDVNMGLFNQVGLGYVNVLQPVYAGGKIKTANNLASLNVEVKERQQHLTANEIILKAEQQYWQVVIVQEKQQTLEGYIQFLDTLYRQVNAAFKSGMIIKNDLLKVTIKQQELQVIKIQLANERKLALMQLCQTIGADYDPEIILSSSLADLSEPGNYFVEHNMVLAKRAEYQLFEKAAEGSKLETKLKRADYMPSLGVGVTAYYMDQFESNQSGAGNGMAYASLNVPISDWWGAKHKLQELKLRESITKNSLEDSKGLLLLQMEKAWTDVMELNEKIHLIQATLLQTEENLAVNQKSYNNGMLQLSDLLEAQVLKTETQDKLIEAKSHYKIALTKYLQVTGR